MGKRILVTDSDPSSTRLVEFILSQRGYEVITAGNGPEGLKKARDEGPDLVVLDVMLPGMDGFEVCHQLRAERQTAGLPILMLSGRAQGKDKATALKMGADDYLAKPATPADIISRIEALLARRVVATSKIVAFIGPQAQAGTTTALANAAIAMSKMGKRVIAVDLCPYAGSISQRLGLKPEDALSLPKTAVDGVKPRDVECALVVHETGVKVIRVLETPAGAENALPSTIETVLNRLGDVTDYCLVDLPFAPGAATRVVLGRADLVIVVSDCRLGDLSSARSAINILRFMGIPPERMGAAMVDSKGLFPGTALAAARVYMEASLGIALLGAIPHTIGPASDDVLVSSGRELAQQIMAREPGPKPAPEAAARQP